jgi:hypothetical protein
VDDGVHQAGDSILVAGPVRVWPEASRVPD